MNSSAQAQLDAAFSQVSAEELRRIVTAMTAIPSPSGSESESPAYLVGELTGFGLEATHQRIDERQANAVGRIAGDGTGPELMLDAPIDMHIAGDGAADGPWVDFTGRRILVPRPVVEGDFVVGLGAENPKGHGACVVMAAAALARANILLRGTLLAGFGAGGMPVNRSPDPSIGRSGVAHGSGCAFMLEHGFRPDFAVIAKPGAAVAYEEVGLCWFEIVVYGDYSYAGIPLRSGGRNAVLDAASVAAKLNAWFPEYTARKHVGARRSERQRQRDRRWLAGEARVHVVGVQNLRRLADQPAYHSRGCEPPIRSGARCDPRRRAWHQA